MQNHILLMEGPDAKGLIYHVTTVLYNNSCNILKQDEYVSPSGLFFMRTEFVSSKEFDAQNILIDLRKHVPDPEITFRINQKSKKNVVVLCTKEHHCISEILIRYMFNELNCNVLAVVSNHNVLDDFVSKFNIPFHCVSAEGQSRDNHEKAVLEVLSQYSIDYLVLAKYMRILTPDFVSHYSNRIINIHHSFLPAFIGANPYKQAFDRGVKIIGATAHFVNNHLDEGPIIAQDTKEVDHRFSAADMAKDGKDIEKMVLIKALKLVLDDRVFIYDNRTIVL